MWMTPPETMCNKHLIGEHLELHMFVGTINKGTSIKGFLSNNLLEPISIVERHRAIVVEMQHRGFHHESPLAMLQVELPPPQWMVKINAAEAQAVLHSRCPECLALYQSKIKS